MATALEKVASEKSASTDYWPLAKIPNFALYLTHTDRQTDIFPETVKSCLGQLKTCKSMKNRESIIFTKSILSSSIWVEESKY